MKFSVLLIITGLLWTSQNTTFYKALQSNSIQTIEAALTTLAKEKASTTNSAYKGTLLTKKASFEKSVTKKIALFKEGAKLLETAIAKYPNNAEYRFLRLAIQENAPKILKYNKNITEDKEIILAQYPKLNSSLRSFIKDYAKQSKIITLQEL